MTEEVAHKQALVVKDKWEEIITDAFRFGYLTNDLCLGCGKVGCTGCPAGTYTGWHPSIRNKIKEQT